MKIAQLIGPYRSDTVSGIQDNITIATAYAKALWREGYAVICPHANSAYFDGHCKDEAFLDGYKEIMRRLDPRKGDTLVTLPHWTKSIGSIAEYSLGLELNLPFIHKGELPWQIPTTKKEND